MDFSHQWTQLSTLCFCANFKQVPSLACVQNIITAIAECARNGDEKLFHKTVYNLLLPALDGLSKDDKNHFLLSTKYCINNLPYEIRYYIS
jgi:hypothetical protein